MCNKIISGFTLIEMIIAIIIISIGLAGILMAFNVTVKSSADPLINKQMIAIAEEMLEEILLKPYAIGSGAITGCNRANADDIRDYNGYSQSICDIDGTAIPSLSSYNVSVVVNQINWQGITADTLKIDVTVTKSGQTITLTGWRTNFA